MLKIACTRFNNDTWEQNKDYRRTNNIEGCIYGSPVKIRENIPYESWVFVLEMNNDKNKIEGVGLIKNRAQMEKYYKIYKDGNYNRFIYQNKYRIERSALDDFEEKVFKALDCSLFKGARHSKRGHGIQQIPIWVTKNIHKFNFINFFRNLFISKYPQTQMPLH